MKTRSKKSIKKETVEEPKKLSKIAEFINSGKSYGTIVNMKAVLK